MRQQLHERFDHWLDELETQLPESEATLAQVSATIWKLRQDLTAAVAQTIVEQTHHAERDRASLKCPQCDRLLKARAVLSRTVQPLIGEVEVQRPSFSCRTCHLGRSPLDEVLGVRAGRMQRDVQQLAADVAIA